MESKRLIGCDEKNNPNDLNNRPSLSLLKNKVNLIGAEIGVRWGCNALRMLLNLDIKLLYLVDPYKPFPVLKGGLWMDGRQDICDEYLRIAEYNLEGFDNIVWVKEFSRDSLYMIDDNLDFVYIDGDHRYEAVKEDIELYLPKVRVGGMLCGHDFTSTESVRSGVLDMFGKTVSTEGDDWWIIKQK